MVRMLTSEKNNCPFLNRRILGIMAYDYLVFILKYVTDQCNDYNTFIIFFRKEKKIILLGIRFIYSLNCQNFSPSLFSANKMSLLTEIYMIYNSQPNQMCINEIKSNKITKTMSILLFHIAYNHD